MPLARIPSKPQAPIAYDLFEPGDRGNAKLPVVVLVNGLGLPASSWKGVLEYVRDFTQTSKPRILSYDRYGQGETTSRDPVDEQPGKEPGYGHDLTDSVQDLHELVQTVIPGSASLVLVAASIGVHIARLYAHKYEGTVTGLISLDSNIGNIEFTDMWPDPHSPSFRPDDVLADDCTMEQYIYAYEQLAKLFNSYVKNGEGLDRRNVKQLLPDPSTPKLKGPDGRGPWLAVIGHDPETFAEEGLQKIKTPKSITRRYTQPAWHAYNEGLLKLSDADRTSGVIFAPGCGHFVQRDNPEFVANQLEKMLQGIMGA